MKAKDRGQSGPPSVVATHKYTSFIEVFHHQIQNGGQKIPYFDKATIQIPIVSLIQRFQLSLRRENIKMFPHVKFFDNKRKQTAQYGF